MNYSGKIYDSIGPLITNERGCGAILSSPCTLKAIEYFTAKDPTSIRVTFDPSQSKTIIELLREKLERLDGVPCNLDDIGARLKGRFLVICGVPAEDKAALESIKAILARANVPLIAVIDTEMAQDSILPLLYTELMR